MKQNKVMNEVLGDTPDLAASDLYSAEFATAFRGFDRAQVRGFLERAADSFESLQRQIQDLQRAAAQQREQIAHYQALEHTLTEALTSAQQLNQQTVEQAQREAELMRREAQQVLEAARKSAYAIPESLRDEINGLKALRKRLRSDLRAVLDIHGALLRGDDTSNLEMLDYLPADGAAYLDAGDPIPANGGVATPDDADVSIIESEMEDATVGAKDGK